MDRMIYFYELYEQLPRCGPGDNKSTAKAYRFLENVPQSPYILDIGCGSGMQTLELARLSSGTITALDNHQPFLDKLGRDAKSHGLAGHIKTKNASMLEMNFERRSFDIVWSEGALYIMGFREGLKKCIEYLRPGGYMGVTEAVWLSDDRPQGALDFWSSEYPGMMDVEGNLALIEDVGFELVKNFTLPVWSWLTDFYDPMREIIESLKEKYENNKTALRVYDEAEKEMHIFKSHCQVFGYEFFVMRKPA